ncbi:MAG TPA: flagellar basal-body MS-ring/collar protein FliF [Acidobacteriota bacterium]|nr:flagellar basal-body MS-ring/collar protein FliF [Acidobacteriota bacterium]
MAEERGTAGQISQLWARVPGLARVAILAVAGVVLAWFVWTGAMAVLRPWEPLAAGISDTERARVLEYLRSNNVEYKFEGDTIMVPAEAAAELKIEMAGQELHVGQLKGLERLETTSMGDTEKTIAAKRQLALQEEIQKALNSLPLISTSQVKLALPPDTGFLIASREPAKASVWLTLSPGATLSHAQVRGLQIQIAHSIQNLLADDVSILDHNSNLLSSRADGDSMLAEMKLSIEQEKREKILQLLDKKVGPGSALVSVTAELETVSRKSTSTEIDTSRPAERVRKTREEEESTGMGAQGVPGTETNTGEETATASGGGGGNRTLTEEESQIDYPTTLTEVERRPGEIVRQSVAVVIDLRRTEGEDGSPQFVSWGEENLQRWQSLLQNAVGIDEQRGDVLTLEEDSFEHSHRMEVELEQLRVIEQSRRMYDILDWSDWTSLIKIPVIILLAFMVLWFVIRPMGKRIIVPLLQLPAWGAAALPERLPRTVEELEAEMEGRLEEELDIGAREVKKGTILKKRITELAKAEPETFMQLIRSWLYE